MRQNFLVVVVLLLTTACYAAPPLSKHRKLTNFERLEQRVDTLEQKVIDLKQQNNLLEPVVRGFQRMIGQLMEVGQITQRVLMDFEKRIERLEQPRNVRREKGEKYDP